MADYTAIYSVGSSIAAYLQHNYPPELQTACPATFQLVSSAQIAEEDQTNLTNVASIFLHRITTNENCRAANRIHDSPDKQASLYLDLHYLITYWGSSAQAEQTVLAWTMLQLQSSPILDNSILTPKSTWGVTETVQLVPADLSLEDILRIWDALGPKYRLSVSYIARIIRIDRARVPEPPVVATRFALGEKVAQ
jgi:hypothetical protein